MVLFVMLARCAVRAMLVLMAVVIFLRVVSMLLPIPPLAVAIESRVPVAFIVLFPGMVGLAMNDGVIPSRSFAMVARAFTVMIWAGAMAMRVPGRKVAAVAGMIGRMRPSSPMPVAMP